VASLTITFTGGPSRQRPAAGDNARSYHAV
jgi:hypothetical protein